MIRARLSRLALLAALLTLLAAAPGCALWNSYDQTKVVVQMGSGEMLHLAAVPRVLPDGTRPKEQLDALLKDVAKMAGGYTLIDNVLGGWLPAGQETVIEERNDLLLVKGPPEVAYLLRARLAEDFQQVEPFVESVPIQSIAVIYKTPPATARQSSAPEPAGQAR